MAERAAEPTPKFRRGTNFLLAETRLTAFAGYRKARTPRRSLEGTSSDGLVTLFAEPTEGHGDVLTSAQNAAVLYLLANQGELSQRILEALFERYPSIREDYLEFTEDDEADEVLPPIATEEELKGLIGLANVHVLVDESSEAPYIGFEFGCSWDDEGGLGIMTQQGRVIAIGQAETAFEPPSLAAPTGS